MMTKEVLKDCLIRLGYHSRPDFIIVGAQKAGTSALSEILSQHPRLTPSGLEELHFFDRDEVYNKGTFYYHRRFPMPYDVPQGNLLFEKTPSYLYHPKVADRIYRYDPKMKIIIILRDPAYRALSAWNMYHYAFKTHPKFSHHHDPRSFQEVIEAEMKTLAQEDWYSNRVSYVKRGIYCDQIVQYQKYFPREQILILEQDDLVDRFQETLSMICKFLNVPEHVLVQKRANEGKVLDLSEFQESIAFLKDFYKPHNERLFELIGRTYPW